MYRCSECDRKFASRSGRSRHTIVVHQSRSNEEKGLLDIPPGRASETSTKVRAQSGPHRKRLTVSPSTKPAAAPRPRALGFRSSPISRGISRRPSPTKVAQASSPVCATTVARELPLTDEKLVAFLTDWCRPQPISSSAEIDALGATETGGKTNLQFFGVDLTDCLGDCLPLSSSSAVAKRLASRRPTSLSRPRRPSRVRPRARHRRSYGTRDELRSCVDLGRIHVDLPSSPTGHGYPYLRAARRVLHRKPAARRPIV